MSQRAERDGGRRRAATLAALAVGAAALAGCQKALFPDNAPRTQYEAYDRSRGDTPRSYVFDEFGREQPNLRERMSPKRSGQRAGGVR